MSISTREFSVTMEVLGANRLRDVIGTRFDILVPCFETSGVTFFHSGSYYILSENLNESVLREAIGKVGEEKSGDKHFWFGEIHTITGLITLCLVLEKEYSKERFDEVINKVYSKLLDVESIKNYDLRTNVKDTKNIRLKLLLSLLREFDSYVNPYANKNLTLSSPSNYLEKLDVSFLSSEEKYEKNFSLIISSDNACTKFCYDVNEQYYKTEKYIKGKWKDVLVEYSIIHYTHNNEECVYLSVIDISGQSLNLEDDKLDIDLRINLSTLKAWKTYHENEMQELTLKQINTVIHFVRKAIHYIKKNVINQMIIG
ncbi:MAG: hypothetical protein IJ809_06815 [Clostridia bacterium]|nr:hypothetical protein [Clostridia bacterium]